MSKLFSALLLLLTCSNISQAQFQSEKKHYGKGISIGDVMLMEEWEESDGKQSSAVYVVEINSPGRYYVKANTNMQKGMQQMVTVNGRPASLLLKAQTDGWQQSTAEIHGGVQPVLSLSPGRHVIRLTVPGNVPPLNDAISISRSSTHAKLDAGWQAFLANLNRMLAEQSLTEGVADKSIAAATSKVLSNPEGTYEHAIDTAFSYSTVKWVSLTAGSTYTFSTYNSTKDPVLHLFDAANLPARSWSDDDGGPGVESSLTVTAPATGLYILLARPFSGGASGITNIQQNGVDIAVNTPIAGLKFFTTPRTGDLNYFTCRLTGGETLDTRIFTLSSSGGIVTGYNDDYFNTSDGTWEWDLASRIKKNYSSGSNVVFVCAFNAAHAGICDVYMGNGNGQLHISEPGNFPLLANEDAIQSAPSSGTYNCISWSGGITSSWSWPPDPTSPWHVANNELAGFDKFYSNSPVRYPGAKNYSRLFATPANAVVDLWKAGSNYKHGSVRKPGNDHPHGYDWESKPGGLDRQFHPRNALENANWYGAVTDYYRYYSFIVLKGVNNQSFATDADAVAAGVAVYENAKLSAKAKTKLGGLVLKTNDDLKNTFNQLYENWKKTWAANASLSDPYAYCNNSEFEQLLSLCNKNNPAVLPLVFEKYTNGEHLTTKLLWVLTRSRYAALLDEAKREIENNPYDEQGRFKIHGDHDNGVRYIEKILQQLEIKETEPVPVDAAATFTVTASPVPVKDVLTITVTLKEESRMSVLATSSRTGNNRLLQQETIKAAGTYQYQLNKNSFAGTAGDIIMVQVRVNGVLQTVKALVGN